MSPACGRQRLALLLLQIIVWLALAPKQQCPPAFVLQAAAFMRAQIADAYDKWTTGFYDYIQSLQNKIPY